MTDHLGFRKVTRAVGWRMEGRYETRVRGTDQRFLQQSGAQIEKVMAGVERLPQIGELLKRETDGLFFF